MVTVSALSLSVSLCLIYLVKVRSSGVTCRSCQDVAAPRDCNVTVICGRNEICYTREFITQNGNQGFRLGCESRARCSQFLKTSPLIGRRDIQESSSSRVCYDCCSSDLCNTGLCVGSVGKTTPDALTPHHSGKDCPDPFKAYKDNCYLFSSKPRERPEAASYCWGFGANLTSIASQGEQHFIVQEIKALSAPSIYEFWLGGMYNAVDKEWQWFDGSNFTYSNWDDGLPPAFASSTHYRHYAMIGNPDWISSYRSAPWMSTTRANANRGVICKM